MQSSFAEIKEFMEQGQHYLKMESFEYPFERLLYSLKKVLVQVCAKLPSQGAEPFNWKARNKTKKHYHEVEHLGVCIILQNSWKKLVMAVCMQYAIRNE